MSFLRTLLMLVLGILFSFEVFSKNLICKKQSCDFYGNHPFAVYGKKENTCTYLQKSMSLNHEKIKSKNYKWNDTKNYVNCEIKEMCQDSNSRSNYFLKNKVLKIKTYGFIGEQYGEFSMESTFHCELETKSLKYANNIKSSTQEINMSLSEEEFCKTLLNKFKNLPPMNNPGYKDTPTIERCMKSIQHTKNKIIQMDEFGKRLMAGFYVENIKSYSDFKSQAVKELLSCKENFMQENYFKSSKNFLCNRENFKIKIFGNNYDKVLGIGVLISKENKEKFTSEIARENVNKYFYEIAIYGSKGSPYKFFIRYNKKGTELVKTLLFPTHIVNNQLVINDYTKDNRNSLASETKDKQNRFRLQKKAEEEERKRKALEQRIAELEKKNKELQQPKKKQPAKPKSSSGSGFFISKLGHIITNQHVVNKCSRITIGDRIDKQVPAELLETDKRNDLALLKTTSLKLASAETKSLIQKLSIEIVPLATGGLMRGNDVKLGEDVLVAGFPYGDIFSKNIKVTKGIVSSTTGIKDDSGQFQLDAAVQPGNSGGPIYDKYGNIVGVVVAQLNKFKMAKAIGSMPENVNFGIKASTVKQFLNETIPTRWSERNKEISTTKLSEIAKKQTVMVVCNR